MHTHSSGAGGRVDDGQGERCEMDKPVGWPVHVLESGLTGGLASTVLAL